MKKRFAIVLFWWFLIYANAPGVQVVGPFANQTQCSAIQAQIVSVDIGATSCWNDGSKGK